MLYRLRFDSYVGGILKRGGYGDTASQLDFWPMGETARWVVYGKEEKLKPVECAALAVCEVARMRLAVGSISRTEASFLASMAEQTARENGARPEILHLALDYYSEFCSGKNKTKDENA